MNTITIEHYKNKFILIKHFLQFALGNQIAFLQITVYTYKYY